MIIVTSDVVSRFLFGRQKIFTCRLVCGECRQVCDKIGACRPTKKSALVGWCAVNSDKSATKSGLVGRYLTMLDLKTSCRALSASVRWTKTICRGSRVPQPMRNCRESREQASFQTWRRSTRLQD